MPTAWLQTTPAGLAALPTNRGAERSLLGLKWLNGLVAAMLVGFGPFVSLYLTAQLWSPARIGLALSIGTMVAMAAQVPAGALVDTIHSKPLAAGAAISAIILAAALIASVPAPAAVIAALAIQGMACGVLTPAIAAITLALSRRKELSERFGNNVRYAAIGSVIAAALMGAVGYWLSQRAIFLAAGAVGLAALLALRAIHPNDIADAPSRTDHPSAAPPGLRAEPPRRMRDLCLDRHLLTCASCVALFQLGNAAVFPLAVNEVTRASVRLADFVVPAAIIVPQVVTAALSPWLGRLAETWGRRPITLVGLAALPLRVLLFAVNDDPYLMVLYQALDGISASVVGIMLPLIVADVTQQGGRFNLGMGLMGFISSLGATLSNVAGGAIATQFGHDAAFAALGAAGLAALLLTWFEMPDTALREPAAA